MPRSVRRYLLSSGIAACALLAGPVAGAQASNRTIITTFNHWASIIKHDDVASTNAVGPYAHHHKVKPLVTALNHEVADLHAFQHALSGESASTGKGHKAKRKIVTGLGLIARAYGTLAREVKAAQPNLISSADAQAAVSTVKRGKADLNAGRKLLRG